MNRKERRRLGKLVPISKLDPDPQVRRIFQKIGRNDLCPCGSGEKFKNCSCYNDDRSYYDFGKEDTGKTSEESGGDKISPALP